jgi:hypothetical protein
MNSPGSASAPSTLQAFRSVPRTGVVYVTQEAMARGYKTGDPEWSNLGQGQPETGPLPGAPPRVTAIDIDPADHYYAPVAGIWELREAVASLYNRLYRKGSGDRGRPHQELALPGLAGHLDARSSLGDRDHRERRLVPRRRRLASAAAGRGRADGAGDGVGPASSSMSTPAAAARSACHVSTSTSDCRSDPAWTRSGGDWTAWRR